MDVEDACSSADCLDLASGVVDDDVRLEEESVLVKRKTLHAVLEQCQSALELLNEGEVDEDGDGVGEGDCKGGVGGGCGKGGAKSDGGVSEALRANREADELCDLLKSRVECPDFLEKLECAQISIPQNITEEGGSWDVVSEDDLWEDDDVGSNKENYVVVRQEDIVEGIACFMAAHLLSLKQTKLLARHSQ